MKKNNSIIDSTKLENLSDYLNVYKKINLATKNKQPKTKSNIKIALLSSFTINGIKESLFVKCHQLNILPEFYQGNYNQYSQEILNENSQLYRFNPDLIILFIDVKSILGDYTLLPYQISNQERKYWHDENINELKALTKKISEISEAKILLHNFEVPLYSPLGITENKQEFGFKESIESLNSSLRNTFKHNSQVFIFDYDSFCSKIGKQHILDYKMYYLGDLKLNLQYIPDLCDEYLAYIKPLTAISKKCIVLDLDNTLWGGIIGEDGIEKIGLGPTADGKPYVEFQKYLLSLFKRGIILAINSKNNSDEALRVLRKHPHMVLKEKNFAAIYINWNDKTSNMKSIAQELNIGLDSMVFIDDDGFNCHMMKEILPEVLTVNLPSDPSLYLKTLMELNDFNTLQITKEDKNRGKIYAEQRKRKEFKTVTKNIDEYLKGLKMTAIIKRANSFTIPRISQLTQKTNQFNMTTKRYQEKDIRKFSEESNYLVLSIKVEDKFGDNGITGVAIVRKETDEWIIDTFLLSCRVIGRGIEETLLGYIIQQAKNNKIKILTGEFIPTKKNLPAKEFYRHSGFKLIKTDNNTELWQYNIKASYKHSDFIKIIAR